MRTILFSDVVKKVKELCIKASYELPYDIYTSLQKALEAEKSETGKYILSQCLENAEIAHKNQMPICQDTGTAIFFVNVGNECYIEGGLLTDAINEGCSLGYKEGYLRASIVGDPLFERKNTNTNTPSIIHIEYVKGNKITITLLPKGGGSENVSALKMLKPSDGKDGVVDFVLETIQKAGGNPCPPVIVGIGIGGTADYASFLAKKALLREVGSYNSNLEYRKLEKELLYKINNTGIGPQGMGGKVTALAVHIEHFPCHIASLPVAISINCHAARKLTVEI